MATLMTVRLPGVETHFISVDTLPLEGSKLHVADHDWIVTRVEEAWGETTVSVLIAEPTPEQREIVQREITGDLPAVS